jgi:excisionase family DNA binding protein
MIDVSLSSDTLTLQEVAIVLRIHPATIYRLAKQGKLPLVKVGGSWRASRKAIEQFLAKQVNE